MLSAALATHERLAAAHALAWVFDTEEQVAAARTRELADLGEADVADAAALATARSVGPAAEVLRAAAELELPLLAGMRASCIDAVALDIELAEVSAAAPELARVSVGLARPLPRRGRAWRGSILVGTPGVAGADVAHVAWQAAHEATVLEVERSAAWLARQASSYEAVERTALGLLRSRARRVGLGDTHGRWLATLDLGALGSIPDVDDGTE
ncbi:MAG: hypothetical protein JWP87_1176 [Labilithrix sp.]|nr:hypothetical protein [Labilithrix sp.]